MQKGKLVIFGGPMFAGKTTALYQWAEKLGVGTYVLVKPSVDTRDGDGVVQTHDGVKMKAVTVDTDMPRVGEKLLKKVTTIFVDELNFFGYEWLKPVVDEWLERGIEVVGAGLCYDFLRQPFGATLPMAARADKFVELFARCDGCGGEASHSYRKVSQKPQVLVGAEESYGACCGECWKIFNSKIKSPTYAKALAGRQKSK